MSEMPSNTGYEPPRNPNQIAGVDKKWWIIGGVAAAGIVYYAYKRNANSVASGSATAGIDPNTGMPYSSALGGTAGSSFGGIDPTTGYSYASEYTAPYPQNSIDPTTGIPFSLEGPIDPTTGIPYSLEGQTPPTPTPTPAPTPSQSSWLTNALKALEANGVSVAHAEQVLGEYLTSQPLTEADIALVEQAIGSVGAAPGNPTLHRVATPTNHPTGGTTKQPTTGKHHKKHPPHKPVAKKPAVKHYKVRAGDTLSAIARRFHLSLKQLEKLNPKIKNPNVIHTGEVINV